MSDQNSPQGVDRKSDEGCPVMHDGSAASDDHGFVIDEAEVVYWGYCPDCSEGI